VGRQIKSGLMQPLGSTRAFGFVRRAEGVAHKVCNVITLHWRFPRHDPCRLGSVSETETRQNYLARTASAIAAA
jgi:hypothetical protein